MFRSLLAVVVVGCVVACQSSDFATSTFIDLTGEARQYNDRFIEYQELTSIAGTLPIPDVGTFYLYPDEPLFRNPFKRRTNGNPFYSIGINPSIDGYSQVLTASYGNHEAIDHEAVQATAKLIDEYQRLIARAIAIRIELTSIRVREFSKGNTDSLGETDGQERELFEAASKALKEADAKKKEAEQGKDDKAKPNDDADADQPGDEKPNENKDDKANDDDKAENDGAKKDDAAEDKPKADDQPGKDDKEPKQADKAESSEALLLKELIALEKQITVKENKIQEKIIDNELIVARWSVSESKGSAVSIPELLGLNSSSKTTKSGYMIVSGLQIKMLVLGPEFTLIPKVVDEGNKQFFDKMKIVSFAVQADQVAYTSGYDFEKAFAGFLELNPKKIASQGWDYLLDFEKVRVEAYIARAGSLDNTGVINQVDWDIRPALLVRFLQIPNKLNQALDDDWSDRGLNDYSYEVAEKKESRWYEVTASENLVPPICPNPDEGSEGATSSAADKPKKAKGKKKSKGDAEDQPAAETKASPHQKHDADRHISIYACQIGSSKLVQFADRIDSPFTLFTEDRDTPEDLCKVIEGRVFVRLHKDDPRLGEMRKMHMGHGTTLSQNPDKSQDKPSPEDPLRLELKRLQAEFSNLEKTGRKRELNEEETARRAELLAMIEVTKLKIAELTAEMRAVERGPASEPHGGSFEPDLPSTTR